MPALAVAAVFSAALTMEGASQASDAVSGAASAATNVQNQALMEQKQQLMPYTQLGAGAVPTLENLLGIKQPGAAPGTQPTPQQTLENLPGYKFAQSQGVDTAKAAGASMGMALSGNTLQGITDRATGIADQTYGSEIDRLLSVAGLGESAATSLSGAIGHHGDAVSNIITGRGQDLAGIDLNEAASLSSIVGNVAGGVGSGGLGTTLKSILGGGGSTGSFGTRAMG